jgi:hypothetical protein
MLLLKQRHLETGQVVGLPILTSACMKMRMFASGTIPDNFQAEIK